MEKLKDEYGTSFDYNKGKDKDSDCSVLTWHVSTDLTVMLEGKDVYNAYGRVSSTLLFITYQNDKIMAEIDNYEKQQLMKDLEL